MKRFDVVNHLIKKHGYKRYLEIGCQKNVSFNPVVAETKVGVDPVSGGTVRCTSDEFFAMNKEKFDIVFIDGLHHCDQVIRDIANSLEVLSSGGAVVVHDCNPVGYMEQLVPRVTKEWNGDVWRGYMHFRSRKDLYMCVVDTDYGCGVIMKGKQKPVKKKDMTYEEFDAKRVSLLNLISVDKFMNYGNKG